MPIAKQQIEEGDGLLRLVMYGAAKTGKTHFATTLADLGYNVILADIDFGYHVTKKLTPRGQNNTLVLPVRDGPKRANGLWAVVGLCMREDPFILNDDTGEVVHLQGQIVPEHNYLRISPNNLNSNDVVIVDSWTALCHSIVVEYCLRNNIKLEEAAKQEWDGYAWCGMMATRILFALRNLNCHLILIGHEDHHEKRSADQKTVLSSRIQMKSTSGNHAKTIIDKFSDVLYFTVGGGKRKIDLRVAANRDGGSRILKEKEYTSVVSGEAGEGELSMAKLCRQLNLKPSCDLDQFDSKAIEFFGREEIEAGMLKLVGDPLKAASAGAGGSGQATVKPEKKKMTFGKK